MSFWYWLLYNISRLIGKVYCSYKVVNRQVMLDAEGGMLVASNHVSFLDPPLVGIGFKQPVYYFARKTLFDHPVANFILTRINAIPVDQGKPELSILKKIIQLLKSGEKVVLFPEGERSWDGKIKEKGEPGIGMIVAKSKVPVLPVRLFGPEKALPRGGKKLQKHPVVLVVGEPVDFSELLANKEIPTKEKYQQIADRIMDEIRALELPEEDSEAFS